jgi:hypothetical protein
MTAAEEQRYTLAEAERELERRECQLHGHRFDVIVVFGSADPVKVACLRCGKLWKVEPR